MKSGSHQVMKGILAGGSLFFAAWGIAAPRSLARAMGVSEETARFIGFRELGAGVVLAGGRGPAPYLPRIVFDVSDAWAMRKDHPNAALGAVGFAALAVAALWLERRAAEHPTPV
jgi:hypothetical protein